MFLVRAGGKRFLVLSSCLSRDNNPDQYCEINISRGREFVSNDATAQLRPLISATNPSSSCLCNLSEKNSSQSIGAEGGSSAATEGGGGGLGFHN